ncbi:MAG: alpha/beta hydrolase [Actinomycetota bacterium]
MTLTRVDGSAGAPWERELQGTIEQLTVESELLADNPLGDPARRPLYVYLPRGYDPASERRYPTIYVIQGFTGQVDTWLNRSPFEPNMVERVDALFADGETPPALVVFVDAWTSYGGSQFINSVSTGRYMDYLADEVVGFVDESYRTLPSPEHRGLAGKSSGGYGAMVVPMMRPDVFGALASHAGDALFEVCYLPNFPDAARSLREDFDRSFDVFLERLRTSERFDYKLFGGVLDVYAMAACYSPDESDPGRAIVPFEIDTGRLLPEVWERWLAWDPVRMAPKHTDALASMKRIYLDAGRGDEYFLDLGAQAFSKELTSAEIDHTLELFDGTHMNLQYRYPNAIRELVVALTPSD